MTTHPSEISVSDRLRADVTTLTRDIGPRDRSRLSSLTQAARHVERSLREASPDVQIQPFEIAGVVYENIIARFGPATPETVVIGAHYDSVSESPGADDNASGVAGLLEVARRLSSAR